MAQKPRACILTGFGINCEYETAHALEMAGAQCEFVHFNRLQEGNGESLQNFQIFVLPGGFSFGDDIQAGRVLANKFKFRMKKSLEKFIDSGKPVVGICNGFQVLVQLGALPGWTDTKGLERPLTLMANRSGKFEDRWVRLRTEASICHFAQGMDILIMPIRHGEGQLALASPKILERLDEQEQIVLRYAGKDGMKANDYPDNPNGSIDSIAGICNEGGNVLGMMPHPECHVRYVQSMRWTFDPPAQKQKEEGIIDSIISAFGKKEKKVQDYGNCMPFFENTVSYAKKYI